MPYFDIYTAKLSRYGAVNLKIIGRQIWPRERRIMIFRAAIALAILAPLIGVFLLELGHWGPDINQFGATNGATLALGAYSLVILLTVWLAERNGLFHRFGTGNRTTLAAGPLQAWKITAIFVPMVIFILIGAGGLQTILGQQGSGTFRMSLTANTGILSYLILKCYAPATFAYVVMERATRGQPWSSPHVLLAGSFLAVIALSFGYKTAIVMALLPAMTLLYWRGSTFAVFRLGAIAFAMVVVAYMLMATPSLSGTLEAIYNRVFLWHGGVPWKIWNMYVEGTPFPSYLNTLSTIFSDRLFTYFTGITRSDETRWVMAHFNLMTTFVAGYTPEYILREGHNNAANAFSEGLIAFGPLGACLFAVVAGLLTNALYHLIDNRLKAGDYAVASLASCYLFFALMPWMIGGGIGELMHSSVIFGALTGYALLRIAAGKAHRARPVDCGTVARCEAKA